MKNTKYRAWDKKYHTMLEDIAKPNCNIWMDDDTIWTFTEILARPDRFDVMQYVGVNDRDGNEIYEKDILYTNQRNYLYGVVEYDESRAAFSLATNDLHPLLVMLMDTPIERIGNIYENPELRENCNVKIY